MLYAWGLGALRAHCSLDRSFSCGRRGSLEREKLEPDLLGKAVAGTETRGEGRTVALGEKPGTPRTHRGCSDKRLKKLDFCRVGILVSSESSDM